MSSKHYDIAVIGGSLSARIAATLLAKQGCKVLFLRYREATASEWFHSSLFLEKLLGTLGGRSCFIAQKPIQVLSQKARITLNNDISLENEFNREFGQDGPAVTQWFEALRSQGKALEDLFWENGGLPWPSLKTTARFKLLCVRRKINWSVFDAPITQFFDKLPESATTFVTDLLQGLALKRINQLSRAQAAMLWTQALRPENLKEPDFSLLLSKRFDQFHGLKAKLDDLESLDYSGSRWTGGKLKNGQQFTATTFLLGDTRWINRFNDGKTAPLPLPYFLKKQKADIPSEQISPLLATRVICGGETPLRLALEENEGQQQGFVLSAGSVPDQQLRKQLEAALPFADYTLTEDGETVPLQIEPDTTGQTSRLSSLSLRIGANLYCADSSALLPEMGAAGAALLGLTLSENLTSKRKQGEE